MRFEKSSGIEKYTNLRKIHDLKKQKGNEK